MNPREKDNRMKRNVEAKEEALILNALSTKPWVYSERTLDELIDQHHADYGQKVRAYALEVYNQRNSR